MDRLFVDTSAWFAYANRTDPHHGPVRDLFHTYEGRLVTTNYVFDETVTLCAARLGHPTAVTAGRVILDPEVTDFVHLLPEDERAAWALFQRRKGQALSFTDCTSFVVMRRLALPRAASLDDDFRREGFEVVPAGPV